MIYSLFKKCDQSGFLYLETNCIYKYSVNNHQNISTVASRRKSTSYSLFQKEIIYIKYEIIDKTTSHCSSHLSLSTLECFRNQTKNQNQQQKTEEQQQETFLGQFYHRLACVFNQRTLLREQIRIIK